MNLPNLYSFLKEVGMCNKNTELNCQCFDSFKINNNLLKLGVFTKENSGQFFEIQVKVDRETCPGEYF